MERVDGVDRAAVASERSRRRQGPPSILLLGVLLPLVGCGEAARGLAQSPAEAQTQADRLLGTLASFFGPTELEPTFAVLRPKLLRAALVPSRVFDDATAWTGGGGDTRAAEFVGAPGPARYRVGVRASAPLPQRPGEYQGRLQLRRLEASQYEWRMREDLALGGLRGQDLAAALTMVWRRAEGLTGVEAAARMRRALPRLTAALGRLISLETLSLVPTPSGGSAVTLGLQLTPAGIRATFPRYAAFIEKYTLPMRFQAAASAGDGDPFWDLDFTQGRLTLHCRIHEGSLAPLTGPPRGLPDKIRVLLAYSMTSGHFRIGFRDLEADVSLIREPQEKGFLARFQRAPDWQLPFLVEPLLRAPLRHPFAGEGALLSLSLHDGLPTHLVHEYRLEVEESWILRWLSGSTGALVGAFRAGVEDEADRFMGEALSALRADVFALFSSPEED
jgi:hypothetical protein